ncbi:MAG: diguanylate cyclase, partial [Alphaproteobacteria bacterium]|nr:diguanylate cyclase [Alphaproteobacteria bacterium]
ALLRATSGSVRPMSDFGEPTGAFIGRVMIVDEDEAFVREVLEMGRRRLIEVIVATTAGEASARAREHELDGVFVQVALGEPQGGFRLARRLRDQEFGAAPVAFIADDDSMATRVAAAHAGGTLFLPKPLAESDFIDATRRFAAQAMAEPTRVLVLHEDPQVADQLQVLLEEDSVDLRAAEDPRTTLEMLEAFRPDMLIIEATLPHVTGFDVCRMLRLHPKWQDLPVLIRSNGNSAELRAAAYSAGADDFIGAEIHGQELVDRVLKRTARYRRVRERRDRDPLTGLMTRSVFAELVAGRISESSRVDRAVTVALIDIDRFRQLNDAHGILSGDDVISTLGKLLGARFRIEDLRARWGGSEFAVALSGAPADDAMRVLERLQEEFGLLRFTTASGVEFGATLSVGMATYPDHGDSAEELIAKADEALRTARAQGPESLVSAS